MTITNNFNNYWPHTVNFEAENPYCGENGTPIWDSCSIVKRVMMITGYFHDEAEVTAEYGHNRLFRISHTHFSCWAVPMILVYGMEPWENAKALFNLNSSTM